MTQSQYFDKMTLKTSLENHRNISIFAISNVPRNESKYMKEYSNQAHLRGFFPTPENQKNFFADLYDPSYVKSIKTLPFLHNRNNCINRLKDSNTPYYNVENGERRTCGIPESYERTIWFFGPCFIVGGLVEDKYTLESILQKN